MVHTRSRRSETTRPKTKVSKKSASKGWPTDNLVCVSRYMFQDQPNAAIQQFQKEATGSGTGESGRGGCGEGGGHNVSFIRGLTSCGLYILQSCNTIFLLSNFRLLWQFLNHVRSKLDS